MSDRRPAPSRPSLVPFAALFIAGFALAAPRAHAAWTSTPLTLGGSAGAQVAPQLVSKPDDGFLAAWIDRRDTSGVWVNVVSAAGVPVTPNGRPVAPLDSLPRQLAVAPCGLDGMMLVWSDARTSPRSVWAQRVDGNGVAVWSAAGARVATGAGAQSEPVVVSDGNDGAFVVWVDERNGNKDIYAQHVLSNGTVGWAAGGVAVCTNAAAQGAPRLLNDGAGGMYVAWDDSRDPTLQVFVQRLSGDGTPQWTANGVSVATSSEQARLGLDGTNRLLVAYLDTDAPGTGVFARCVSTAGDPDVYPVSGGSNRRTLVDTLDTNVPYGAVATSTGGGLFVYGSATRIRARHIGPTGNLVWGPVLVASPAAAAGVNVVSDNAGGAWVTWTDGNAVRAQRVTGAGGLAITLAGATLSPATSRNRGAAASTQLPSGTLVAAWQDSDTGGTPDTNVVAQRAAPNGVTGEYYRITATTDGSGSLTPAAGTYYVAAHDSLRFLSYGSGGHRTEHLYADGDDKGAIPNWTFHDVTADHTLAASYETGTITRSLVTAPDVFVPVATQVDLSLVPLSTVFSALWPPDAQRWRFGRWDPKRLGYDAPPDSLTQIHGGAGYWFATHVADTLTITGTPFIENSIAIALEPAVNDSGWNQVGNSFRFPVLVSALRLGVSFAGPEDTLISPRQTKTDPRVIGWDAVNGYQPVSVLEPGRAYFLYKRLGTNITLRMPFEYSQGVLAPGTEPARAAVAASEPADWSVGLVLRQGGAPAARVALGSGVAGRTYARMPASPGRDVALWLTDADGTAEYSEVVRARSFDEAALAYDVFARAEGALAGATLHVEIARLPADREVTLSDPVAGWTRVVHDGDEVSLAIGTDARRLRLAIGAAGATPAAIVTTLRSAGPNPFSKATALSFVLGMPGELRAYVYDVTGRRVADLSRRSLAAGEHVIGWDGRDAAGGRVAPGVYLLRWSAGGRSGTARLVSLQ